MFQTLPDELWVSILSHLPDFNTLKNAALTSSTWLRCAPSACRQVTLNEIGPSILPEAVMALESSRFDSKDLNLVVKYSDKYLKRRPVIPPTISLADGAALSELHKCGRHLASKYQDFALHRLTREQCSLANDRRDWPQPPSPADEPTAAETARFQRALYRFEVYRNLFKDPEVVIFNLDVVNFQRIHFFDFLTPWEMEQLVAVRDYLAAAVIGPPLHTLVELRKLQALSKHHCGPVNGQVVYWTDPILPPHLERGDCHIRQNQARLLCFGIKFLYKVSITPTTQFYQLLLTLPQQPRYDSYNRVGEIYVWFSDAVDKCNELSNSETPRDSPVSAWSPEDYKQRVGQSMVTEDMDKGPEEAWYWAYQSFLGFQNNDPRMTNCRLFGLFFWDSQRLEKINFFTRVDFWWWRWEGGRQPDFDWDIGAMNFRRFS
ncbi:hypothetical protein CkaCkLH20_10067 [Colletotrichum karsti]|uniref:F-box domain-containing protein n=1 Tax=Colletotrichum karsti TaxID=1095194 RepID=A0A9P6HYM7_9PEZI|nr:uncharacterized protein CkaCkLH20_10067 [Colletotrichum karsti]KAF9872570.1 hypothetical protein CkaCkLH20_10067 [Colletotrichum karsti]